MIDRTIGHKEIYSSQTEKNNKTNQTDQLRANKHTNMKKIKFCSEKKDSSKPTETLDNIKVT